MSKLKYLRDKDSWLLAEDIPDIDFYFSQIWLSCFVNQFKSQGGRAYRKILAVYKNYHLWFYYGEKDSLTVGEHLVRKFIADHSFIKKVNKKILYTSDKLRQYCQRLPETNLHRYSNEQLWKFYNQHDRLHTVYYQWGWIPVGADMFHNNLTEKLKQYLRSIDVSEDRINEYFVVLTQPTKKSLIQIENEGLLKIGVVIQKDKHQEKLFRDLYVKFKEQEVAKLGYETHSKEYEEFFENSTAEIKDSIRANIYRLI